MCNFKSGIILKDRVFVPGYDNHSKMLEELKISDNSRNPAFIRAELIPPNGDVFSDINTWIFKVDQDYRPEWFVSEVDEARMREAVKSWALEHIFIGVNNLKINAKDREVYYLKDCKNATVRAWDNATVEAWGNATVEAWDNATVEASGNATVRAWGNATVEAWDNATVRAWGNATVEAWDNATVRASGNATVRAWDNATVEASGNATVRAWGNATVEAWDNATVEASGNATVRAWGNATVEAWDNATVRAWDNATVEASGNATVIIPEWSSNKRKNIVLMQNSTLKDCKSKTIYQSGDWTLVLVKEA